MNCITHTSEPAVATCSECGVGLCAKCFKESQKNGTKPVCRPCIIKNTEAYIGELEEKLGSILGKKIIYAIMLVSGAVILYCLLNDYLVNGWWYVAFFLLWGTPGAMGYYDWSNRSMTISQEVHDGMFAAQSPGTYMVFKILGLVIVFGVSSALFPIYFAFYVLFAGFFVKRKIQEAKAAKEALEAEELAFIEANAKNTQNQNPNS